MRPQAAILAAFKRAAADDRLDVAEHPVKTVETLQPEDMPGAALAEFTRVWPPVGASV